MTSAWEVVEVLRMLSRPKHLLEEDAFYEGVALLGKIRDVGVGALRGARSVYFTASVHRGEAVVRRRRRETEGHPGRRGSGARARAGQGAANLTRERLYPPCGWVRATKAVERER